MNGVATLVLGDYCSVCGGSYSICIICGRCVRQITRQNRPSGKSCHSSSFCKWNGMAIRKIAEEYGDWEEGKNNHLYATLDDEMAVPQKCRLIIQKQSIRLEQHGKDGWLKIRSVFYGQLSSDEIMLQIIGVNDNMKKIETKKGDSKMPTKTAPKKTTTVKKKSGSPSNGKTQPVKQPKLNKKGLMLAMLKRKGGSNIDEIAAAFKDQFGGTITSNRSTAIAHKCGISNKKYSAKFLDKGEKFTTTKLNGKPDQLVII